MSFIWENITDSQKKLKLDNMNSLSKLVLKQPANLSQIFNQFNNTTENHTKILIMLRNANIMTEKKFRLKIPNKNKSFSMFHVNACSLGKNFDDPKYLLKTIYVANYLVYKPRTNFQISKKTLLGIYFYWDN